jgi:hypothetical protein
LKRPFRLSDFVSKIAFSYRFRTDLNYAVLLTNGTGQMTSDDFAQRFLGAPETKEALEWLKGSSDDFHCTLGEHESTSESIQLVEQFYAAGAAKVLAVEIFRYEEGENTGNLLIELSNEQQAREKVLAIAGEISQSQGFDAEPDSGQQYVFLMLD